MEDDWWLNPEISLARQLDLEARLDSALVSLVTMDHLLRQSLGRVIELEAREAAAAPAPRHQEWARDLLAELGVDQAR